MEQQLGSLILATDISRQNEFLTTFREHLGNQDLDLRLAAHRHFILQVRQRPLLGPPSHAVQSRRQDALTSTILSLDCTQVCGRVQPVPRVGAEPAVEREGVRGILQAG